MWHRRFLFMDSKLRFLISSEWNNQGAKQAQGDLNQLASSGSKLTTIATGAVVAGGAAAAAFATKFVADSVREFGNFEKGMREVFTLLPNLSGDAREKMTRDTRVLASEMGRLPDEVVPALYQAISAGVPQENVFEFLKTANEAARGGVTDLETAVDGLSSVVNAYGSDVLSVGEASDAMFTAVKLGKTNFEELSRYLFNVVPTASAVGLEFTNITAALAAMTAQGTPTSVATTQLRQVLVELNQEGSKASKIFNEVAGMSFAEFIANGGNLNEALQLMEQYAADTDVTVNNLFSSVEAGNGALALTGKGADTFSRNLQEMEQAAGATGAAAEEMSESGTMAIEEMNAAWANLKLVVGQEVAPVVTAAARGMTEAITTVSGTYRDKMQELVESTLAGRDSIEELADAADNLTTRLNRGNPFATWLLGLNEEAAVGYEEIAVQAIAMADASKTTEEALRDVFGASLEVKNGWVEVNGVGLAGIYTLETMGREQRALAEAQKVGAFDAKFFAEAQSEANTAVSTGQTLLEALTKETPTAFNVAAVGIDGLGKHVDDARVATSGFGRALASTAWRMDEMGGAAMALLGNVQALSDAQYEQAFRSGLQESERYVTELISAQEALAESQGEWVETSRDTSWQVGRIHEQLAADLTDEQAKAYREMLSTAVEGSAEWRQAWQALQGDLTATQRNELVAQVADLQVAHGQITSIYTGDADAAEEAKTRILAAQAEIREAYRQTAFEQLLAQADMSQLPAILEWAESQGIIAEGEAELRLQFAETMAAIESKTSALAEGQEANDDYMESISLLTTGLFDNEAQASSLAARLDGEMVQAFMSAAAEGGSLAEVVERLGWEIEAMPDSVTVSFFSDTSNWTPPEYTDQGTVIQGQMEAAGHVTMASGGRVTGGIHGRDSVRAMLMPGEYVVRTDAAERIGYDTLDALNRGGSVAMGGGGTVMNSVGGDTYNITTASNSQARLVATLVEQRKKERLAQVMGF